MASKKYDLLIGTTNPGKGKELVELLSPYGFAIRTLKDFDSTLEVIEDGDTFAANAQKKAREFAQHYSCWTLADDSGIQVHALNGAPGIYSARYAGESATDEQNNQKLLADLAEVPATKRTANYYCHVAVADPSGEIRAESSGTCSGIIRQQPVGTNGFGYDPLFEVVEYHRTFGELGSRVKSAISHRARAMRAMVPQLAKLSQTGKW